jgi:hypothetical protein
MTKTEIELLATKLQLHAHELVNGGTNASELRNDLRKAADVLLKSIPRSPTTDAIRDDVRDEDVAAEVVKIGDRMIVSTPILREWIDNGGTSAVPVVVTDIRLHQETGTKTITIGLLIEGRYDE